MITLRLLGDLRVWRDGVAVPALTNAKAGALLAVLVLEDRPLPRAQLADWFWPQASDESARANLRFTLAHLRRLLPDTVLASRHAVALAPGQGWQTDIAVLDAAPSLADPALQALLTLRVEDFLLAVRHQHAEHFGQWVHERREALCERMVGHLGHCAQALADAGRHAEAVAHRRRLVALQPWSEAAHLALMQALADRGDHAAALAQFDTCRQQLARELDIAPGPDIQRLADALRQARRAVASPGLALAADGAGAVRGITLPPAAARLIGRQQERATLAELLGSADARWITVCGPGGCGKTALALAALHDQARLSDATACFVPLADLSPQAPGGSAALIAARIAETLALQLPAGDSLRALVTMLAGRRWLLLLDNLEQLADAADALQALVQSVPGLRLLVTSRHLLGRPLEWALRIDGLPVEDARGLFQAAAQRVQPQLCLDDHADDVRQIVQATAGVPLALELAARWLLVLPLQQIAQRLGRDLGLIQAGAPGQPGHGMAAVLQRSWALLTPDEQSAFAACGLFSGRFTLAAGGEVAGCTDVVLGQLVAKSMLRLCDDGRLQCHPVLRELALQQGQATEDTAACRRFERLVTRRLDAATASLGVAADVGPLLALQDDRADLQWVFEARLARGDLAALTALMAGLWALYRLHGWFEDVAVLLERALRSPRVPAPLAACWLLWRSEALYQLGDHPGARDAALGSLDRLGDTPWLRRPRAGRVAGELWQLWLGGGRWTGHRPVQPSPDDAIRCAAYNRLAQLAFFEGDRLHYLATHLRSVNLARGHGNAALAASAALVLVYTPLAAQSRRLAAQAARLLPETEPFDRAWAHELLCLRALSLGRFDEADGDAVAGHALFQRLRQRRHATECAALSAYCALFSGRWQTFESRMQALWTHAGVVHDAAGQAWAASAHAYLGLRFGVQRQWNDAGITLEITDTLVDAVVDPNTELLWQGIRAWVLARRQQHAAATRTLERFLLAHQSATMYGIYALNGYVGAAMACIETDSAHGPAVLAALDRFARALPAARATACLLQARMALAQRDVPRARRQFNRMVALLPAGTDPHQVAAGLLPADALDGPGGRDRPLF